MVYKKGHTQPCLVARPFGEVLAAVIRQEDCDGLFYFKEIASDCFQERRELSVEFVDIIVHTNKFFSHAWYLGPLRWQFYIILEVVDVRVILVC